MKPNNGRYNSVENIPEIGDVIYIPTALHVYRGVTTPTPNGAGFLGNP